MPGDKQSAVGIAVKCHSEIGLGCEHGALKIFQVQGATAEVDVAPVGCIGEEPQIQAKSGKHFAGQRCRGAVGAIHHHAARGRLADALRPPPQERHIRNHQSVLGLQGDAVGLQGEPV